MAIGLVLASLVATFGGAERAASADLPGGRGAPLAAATIKVCKSGCGSYDYTTISEAVSHASSGDEIHVAEGTYNETVLIRNKSLVIKGGYSKDWGIHDPAQYLTTIDGGSDSVVSLVSTGGDYTGTIDGFTITGGDTTGAGGGVSVNKYRATISHNVIKNNTADGNGGGIVVIGATVTIDDNTIRSNVSQEQGGGGIMARADSHVTITNNRIISNRSVVGGGGIRIEDSEGTFEGNEVTNNTTSNTGGGLAVVRSDVDVEDNDFSGNKGTKGGGGIQFSIGSTGLISNNRLVDNEAGNQPGGGGIHFWQCAPQYGGAPQFVGNTVTDNTSDKVGGGVNIEDSTPLIQDNVITDNHADDQGGGLNITVNSAPTLIGNTIAHNTASVKGGGIFCYDSAPKIRRNEIVDNQAPTAGGIHLAGCQGLEITNNFVARNKATIEGGGIHLTSNSGGSILNNTLVNNNLGAGGEAINLRNNTKPRIANNIMVGQTHGVRVREDAAPTVEYNDVWQSSNKNYDGVSAGPGAVSCDPEFVNLSGGDYHLTAGSCVIDKGTASGAPTTDFDGDPRPVDGDENGNAAWDMGADEYFNPVWVTKDVDQQVLEPNDQVSFTIDYRNNSGSTATGVVITDLLSGYLTNVNYSSTGPGVTPRGDPKYIWDVEDLAPWEEGTITITARVSTSIPPATAIINEVVLEMDGYGPFEDEVLIIVGGLTTHTPAVLNDYAQ